MNIDAVAERIARIYFNWEDSDHLSFQCRRLKDLIVSEYHKEVDDDEGESGGDEEESGPVDARG